MSQVAPRPPLRSRMALRTTTRWSLAMLVASLAIGGALIWFAGADEVGGQPLMLTRRPIALHNRQDVGQTFVAPATGLHQVDVFFDSRGEVRSRQVRFVLFDSNGVPVVDQEVDAADIGDSWYSFAFPPLSGLDDQLLRLDLRRNAPARDSIGVWVGPGQSYPQGYGALDNIPDPSFDVAFRAYSALPPSIITRAARVGALADAVSTGRPGLTGQPVTVLSLAGLYALGLAALALAGVALGRRRA